MGWLNGALSLAPSSRSVPLHLVCRVGPRTVPNGTSRNMPTLTARPLGMCARECSLCFRHRHGNGLVSRATLDDVAFISPAVFGTAGLFALWGLVSSSFDRIESKHSPKLHSDPTTKALDLLRAGPPPLCKKIGWCTAVRPISFAGDVEWHILHASLRLILACCCCCAAGPASTCGWIGR